MTSPVDIRIKGSTYDEYKSVTVSYSMETIASGFSVDFSDKLRRNALKSLPFKSGDPVEVFVHGEKVIDGYINSIPIDISSTQHSVAITGRSWTGHIVDCSAVYKGGSWRNANLKTIAKNLCDEHGITVKIDPTVLSDAMLPFPRWAIEDEETTAECLRRAAKLRGMFMMTDNGRNLIFTKTSKIVQPGLLSWKTNILQANREDNFDDRFSYYLVKSQSAGDDTWFADNAGKAFYRVDDPEIATYRPLILVNDGQGRRSDLEARANWERNTRAGKSSRVRYTLQGFKNAATQKLWPVNQLISVNDDQLDINDTLLLISAQLTYGTKSGEKVVLEVGAPQQFDVLAPPPPKKRKKKKISW